jgi:hypothetical protein
MARFDLSGGTCLRQPALHGLCRADTRGYRLETQAIGEPSESDSFVSHLRNYM